MVRTGWRARIGTAGLCALLSAWCPTFATAAESSLPGAVWRFDDLRPTLTSTDGRFSLSFRARLQLDAGGFDQAGDVADVGTQAGQTFRVVAARFQFTN
jgi:hypothetical protein